MSAGGCVAAPDSDGMAQAGVASPGCAWCRSAESRREKQRRLSRCQGQHLTGLRSRKSRSLHWHSLRPGQLRPPRRLRLNWPARPWSPMRGLVGGRCAGRLDLRRVRDAAALGRLRCFVAHCRTDRSHRGDRLVLGFVFALALLLAAEAHAEQLEATFRRSVRLGPGCGNRCRRGAFCRRSGGAGRRCLTQRTIGGISGGTSCGRFICGRRGLAGDWRHDGLD